METPKEKLSMEWVWDRVKKLYKKFPGLHSERITRSRDTALQTAVSEGNGEQVEQLVKLTHDKEALIIGNERGDTPLHLAASLDTVQMCKRIAESDPQLIGKRNHDGETPFFLAALHGRKDVFLCLHSILSTRNDGEAAGYSYSRRINDGETILHCAISGEYFDLAFQIIYLYENLVHSFNKDGFSPLHLLASNSSAFPSCSHLRGFERIIYHCTFVDKLEAPTQNHQALLQELENDDGAKYPENYQTCINFARLLRKPLDMAVDWAKNTTREQPDEENLGGQCGKPQFFPENYSTCFELIKLMSKAMLVVLGLGFADIVKIKETKQKHVWSVQIMDGLLQRTSIYKYEDNGQNPHNDGASLLKEGETMPYDKQQNDKVPIYVLPNGHETPILVAAKYGVVEMVKKILEHFPMAIRDMNSENKNVVLLSVENRQPEVYKFLLGMKIVKDSIFRNSDNEENSVLHLAARLGEPWLIPGAALQMQWEIKWYEFVKNSVPKHYLVRHNKHRKTPNHIFTETHGKLMENGVKWMSDTSQSCSFVAALIATVAFATSSTVPGGVKENDGRPNLENEPTFHLFAISSLIALCFSVTALIMFLAILTSRYEAKDFGTSLPRKLIMGLTSLFVSIASMLVAFCAGHYFLLQEKFRYAVFPLYLLTCLPVTFFAIAQFPLYFDLIWATYRELPQRSAATN